MGFANNVKGFVTRYHSRTGSNVLNTIQSLPKAESDIYSGNLNHEMSSTVSIHSDTSSRKLAKILGPEVLLHSSRQSPNLSRCSSFSLHRNSASTDTVPQVDTRRNAILPSEEWTVPVDCEQPIVFDGEDDVSPASEEQQSTATLPTASLTFEQTMPDPKAISAPNSPDVDALAVAQFPAIEEPAKEDSIDNLELNGSLSLTRNDSIDFNEVCERLLDSLSSPVERPSYERNVTCSSASSASSAEFTVSVFTEPPTPLLESSGSSCSSMIPADKMAKAKSDLVADQVALEAKFKLAAARDALKRVKSNVACPDGFAFRRYAPPAPVRAVSMEMKSPAYIVSVRPGAEPTRPIRASRSYSAVDELMVERTTPRSSRSSRSQRDPDRINPQKSEIRIGVAAPKNLSGLKRTSEQTASKPVPGGHTKTKSKNVTYIPQGHITSIHEVLA